MYNDRRLVKGFHPLKPLMKVTFFYKKETVLMDEFRLIIGVVFRKFFIKDFYMNVSPTARQSLDIADEIKINSLVEGFIKDLTLQEKRDLNRIQHCIYETEMRDKFASTKDHYAKLGKQIGKTAGAFAGAGGAVAAGVISGGGTAAAGAVGAVAAGAVAVGASSSYEDSKDPKKAVVGGVKGAIYGGSLGMVPAGKFIGGEAGLAAGTGAALVRSGSKGLSSNVGFRMNSFSMKLLEDFARRGKEVDSIREYIKENSQKYLEDDKCCVLT